jgi:hypothetical protein
MWDGTTEELLPHKVLGTFQQVCPDCKTNENLLIEEMEVEYEI